jgi:heterodisulfide reductase subunit A
LNITLHTLSEVIEVEGSIGHFRVRLKQSPRYVDVNKCIACGACSEKCPKKVPNEYNAGLDSRKAIYIPYAQSIPLKYTIDPTACIYLTRGKCRACEKFCPTGAIRFDDTETVETIEVGAAILAPGYTHFDPSSWDFYGYGKIPDVVTGIEYERLLSASGPGMGHLMRRSDRTEPHKIAWIQCVGSRNTNRCDNGYCSSVCCMYAIKQTIVTAEHAKGGKIEQTVFFMDMRSPGKQFERYYEDAKEKGVRFLRCRPHSIEADRGGYGVRLRYVTEEGKVCEESFDMAVLSTGLQAPKDNQQLAAIFGFELDRYGFAQTDNLNPVQSTRAGVFVTGAFQAPKAIPRSVTQASAAAASAALALRNVRNSLTKEKTYPEERTENIENPAVGVFICSCGINIAGVLDVQELAAYTKTLPHVVHVENNLFTCSADTQYLIAKAVRENGLNRVVIAACTPRTHESLFQETLQNAQLNGYLLEMANIRNQNSWVHQKTPQQATEKAKVQIRMAVAKVALARPLSRLCVPVVQQALVIGGGVAGMTAAIELAEMGYPTCLVEKTAELGGNARYIEMTAKGEAVGPWLNALIQRVRTHPAIQVMTQASILSTKGSVGNFLSEIDVAGHRKVFSYGIAVLATGAHESKPVEYLYGKDPRVMTHLELNDGLQKGKISARTMQRVVFIQCVGSREPQRPYCSRTCCIHTMKSAIRLKQENPDLDIVVLYRDIRTYGKREALYQQARELGVLFVRYDFEDKPNVEAQTDMLRIECFDPILQRRLQMEVDLLILAAAIEPNNISDLVSLYKCGLNEDGFLLEAHPKLRPVDNSVDGLFVCGLCNYPQPIEEAIAQAKAAVSRAAIILNQKELKLDAIKSIVTERCDGCALCVDVCPYHAIELVESKDPDHPQRHPRKVQTDPALCKGCGMCAATCPKNGIEVQGFSMEQLRAQVGAALSPLV